MYYSDSWEFCVPVVHISYLEVAIFIFSFHSKSMSVRVRQLIGLNVRIVSAFVCLFVFVALRPMSTAMVIAGRSVHLTTLFPGQAWASGQPVICAHTFACNWQQPFLNRSAEGRRMTVEIISWSISTEVWYRAGIELATPGYAVRHASVARHVTDCATRPGVLSLHFRGF